MFKRNIITRIIIIATVLVMLGMALIGCSSGSKTIKGLEDEETVVKNLPPTTLTFYFAGNERNNTKTVLAEIEKQIKNTLNAKLDFKFVNYNSYANKITETLSSGQPIDAFLCGRANYPEDIDYVKLFREGKIADLTELLPKVAPDLYQAYERLKILDPIKIDGKIAALPKLFPSAEVTKIWVDNSLKEKYNISSVKTLQDFDKLIRKAKNEPGLIPCSIDFDIINVFSKLYGYVVLDKQQSFVYKWDDPDMKVIAWEQTPEFNEVASYISKWFKDGLLRSPVASTQTDKYAAYITRGQDTSELKTSINNGNPSNPGQEIYIFQPELKGKVQKNNPIGNKFSDGAMVINKNSKNIERSIMFINWVQASQENNRLFLFGIKDQDYILKNGNPQLPEGTSYNDTLYYGWTGGWSAFRNIETFGKSTEVNQYIDFIDKQSEYAPHEGFVPDYAKIQAQADQRATSISRNIEGLFYRAHFEMSEIDIAITDLKQTGSDDVVAEVQRQLDGWRAEHKN